MQKPVDGIVSYIENALSEYYSFSPIANASGYMINDEGLSAFNDSVNLNADDFSPKRGSVLVVNDGEEHGVFIGIHIADDIVQSLEASDPIKYLDGDNLDKFCLLVEELSHFHLILNRISDNKSVSRLELEWQAEIDKLLISSMLLKKQSGNSHQNQLAMTLFDHAVVTSSKKHLYDTATRYAAKFWYETIKNSRWNDQKVRGFLLRNYHLDWDNKRSNIENLRSA